MKKTPMLFAVLLAGCASSSDKYLVAPPLTDAVPKGRLLYVTKEAGPLFRLNLVDIGRADARELAQSAEPIASPRWSPDSKQFAYTTISGGKSTLHLRTLATGATRALIADAENLGAASWSPDGKVLAVSRMRNGNWDIDLLTIADGALGAFAATPANDRDPAFSPDGKRIVFTSDRGGRPQLWQQRPGGKAEPLVDDESGQANYAPDGETIAFVLTDAEGGSIEVLTMESGERLSLSQGTRDQSPCFSPDGAFVAYTTLGEAGHAIELVSRDGRKRQSLPTTAEVRELSWTRSP